MRRIGRIGGWAVGMALAASPLAGQHSGLREVRRGGGGGGSGLGGVTFVFAEPLDDFQRTGHTAAGITLFGVAPVGRGGALGLRIDGGYLVYDAAYSGYSISTHSSIATLAAGPQLTLGQGPLRFYGFATVGGSVFWTWAHYNDYCGCNGDGAFLDGHGTTVTQFGTGVLLGLGRGRHAVAVDLGVRDARHALVTYVPWGGVVDNGDGTFTVDRVRTPVRMRVYQLGVSVGL